MRAAIEHDRAFAEPKSIDDVDRMRQDMMRKIYYDKKEKSPDCPKKSVCVEDWVVSIVFAVGFIVGFIAGVTSV